MAEGNRIWGGDDNYGLSDARAAGFNRNMFARRRSRKKRRAPVMRHHRRKRRSTYRRSRSPKVAHKRKGKRPYPHWLKRYMFKKRR